MILHTYRCIGRVKEKETLSMFNTYQEKRRKNTKVGTYVLVETFWLINRDNYNGVHAHLRLAMNNQQALLKAAKEEYSSTLILRGVLDMHSI